MEKITTNTKSFELTGEEIHIHFATAFPYFWVRNDSGGTVLMSLSPNIEEGGDGVIEVLAGSSAGTMHGFNCTRNDLYLSGSGKVQVMGTHSPENPFRNAGKGGGESVSGILPHSEGLTAYFDHSKNASETDWTDIIVNKRMEAKYILNNDSVALTQSTAIFDVNLSNAFTIYTVFKLTENTNDWFGIIAAYGATPQFNLCTRDKNIAIGTGSSSGRYNGSISALDYHICTLVFLNGMGVFYVDGQKVHSYSGYHTPISEKYELRNGSNFKMIALYENVAQSPTLIAENTNYIAGKYGIQI